jgi:hypothetical protein
MSTSDILIAISPLSALFAVMVVVFTIGHILDQRP